LEIKLQTIVILEDIAHFIKIRSTVAETMLHKEDLTADFLESITEKFYQEDC